MTIKFINGAYVHRLWKDSTPELLAYFQYDGDAELWAKAKIAQEAKQSYRTDYAITGSHDGSMKIIRTSDGAPANG